MILHTPRLALVPFTHECMVRACISPASVLDDPSLNLAGSPGANVRAVAPDWPNPGFAQALPIIATLVAADPTLQDWNRLIVVRDSGLLVGEIGFKYLPRPEPHHALPTQSRTEVGYGLASSAQKRGYATEALIGMCAFGFANGATRIDADCLWENHASAAVLSRAGFTQWCGDVTLRYWLLWSQHFALLHGKNGNLITL
jgi:[ribosomal protein S5]-alanine N-acetyltransferase